MFLQAEEEIAGGVQASEPALPRTGPRSARYRPLTPLPRRSSASNMQEQSGLNVANGTRRHARRRNRKPDHDHTWSPREDGINGCKTDDGGRSADEAPTVSLHSQEGDTEAANAMVSTNMHQLVEHMTALSLLVKVAEAWSVFILLAKF